MSHVLCQVDMLHVKIGSHGSMLYAIGQKQVSIINIHQLLFCLKITDKNVHNQDTTLDTILFAELMCVYMCNLFHVLMEILSLCG